MQCDKCMKDNVSCGMGLSYRDGSLNCPSVSEALEKSQYVVNYLYLVNEVVGDFSTQKVPSREDLLQIGAIGLFKSYRIKKQYDIEETKQYIREEISKFLMFDEV